LTTICGQGIVFIWLLNTIRISALLVWTSIGFILLQFQQAYKAQGLPLSDLPYQQPLYPSVTTYIGVMLYIVLFCGYVGYEKFYLGKNQHFIPKFEVDLVTDAVWKPGEGDVVHMQDHKESDEKKSFLTRVLPQKFLRMK
jgi:amino acid permease